MLKLAFGCGGLNHREQGYKNVDVRNLPHVDFVTDISQRLPWNDNEVDEILAESVLEHIPHGFMDDGLTALGRAHTHTISVLREWCRVLKVGGKCIVKVPNIKGLITWYVEGKMPLRDFWMYLYGGQNYKENTHYAGFDPETIKDVMMSAGFKDIAIRNYHDIEQNLDESRAWEMAAIGTK